MAMRLPSVVGQSAMTLRRHKGTPRPPGEEDALRHRLGRLLSPQEPGPKPKQQTS